MSYPNYPKLLTIRYKWYLDEINILQSREIAQEKAFKTAQNLLQLSVSEAVIMQATRLTSKEFREVSTV